jgi:trk system potassium uptake protein TrkA
MKYDPKQLKTFTIIIGCGRLGASLANELSEMANDVIVIDRDKSAFRKLSPSYGGLTLIGDATDLNILKKAEIEKATTLIVVTNNDNTNIMISQISKELYGVSKVITRVYDPERSYVYDNQGIETVSPLILLKDRIRTMIHI